MEPTTLLQSLIVTAVPAFLLYTVINILYIKNKKVRTRIDEMKKGDRVEKLQSKLKLYKGLADTLFKHKKIRAYVKSTEVKENSLLLNIHIDDVTEKLILQKSELEKILGNTIEIVIDNENEMKIIVAE
jgi:hypothetical protein